MTSDDSSGLPVGAVLRQRRRRLELSGQDLAGRVGMSQAKISRIETGVVGADPADVRRLARALGRPDDEVRDLVKRTERQADHRARAWLTVPAGVADRQREMAELEMSTTEFRVFQPTLVFGLLQTSEYARAILSTAQRVPAGRTAESHPDVAAAVTARFRRHEILEYEDRRFHFLMAETVLANRLCRPHEMVAQIERLREAAARPNITLRIIPSDARWPAPPYHGFELMDDSCVLVDLFNSTLLSRGRSVVREYQEIFDAMESRSTTDIDPVLDRYAELYLDLSRPAHGHP